MKPFIIIELNDGKLESVRTRSNFDDAVNLAIATAGEHCGVDPKQIEKDLREEQQFSTYSEDVIVYITTAAED